MKTRRSLMMVTSTPTRVKRAGFTLVELLTVIAIIGILGGILIVTVSKVRQSSYRAEGVSNLRQVGVAIQLYANEHNNFLPGPLWGGQGPSYELANQRTLGYHLWPYFGIPEPQAQAQEAAVLASKAYKVARKDASAMSFYLNKLVNIDGTIRDPWGYQIDTHASPLSQPMKVNVVAASAPRNTWAMKDVDQTMPEVAPAGWKSSLPEQPVYAPYRLYLYFDWHVEALKIE
jgi:prepilin-type N-terminal cleavage/methylation domain-containing protein